MIWFERKRRTGKGGGRQHFQCTVLEEVTA